MLLHPCNPPCGPCCQSPVVTGTGVDGLGVTYSVCFHVLPAAFLHKAVQSHAEICIYSVALHLGSGRKPNHQGGNFPQAPWLHVKMLILLPAQKPDSTEPHQGQAGVCTQFPQKSPAVPAAPAECLQCTPAPSREQHISAQQRGVSFRQLQHPGWCSESLPLICTANLQFLW